MLRKVFIISMLFLTVLAISIYFLLQSSWFWEHLIERFVNGHYSGVKISDVHIGKVQWSQGQSLMFSNVQMGLDIDNQAVFGRIRGAFRGDARFNIMSGKLEAFDVSFTSPDGGEIRSELLSYVARYVPQHRQIEELIKNNQTIPMDNAFISMILISAEHVRSNIKLNASKLSLRMNVNMDIHIDGGVQRLLQHMNGMNK